MKKYSILFVLIATLLMSCGKDAEKPTVVTLDVKVTDTLVTCAGNVQSDGGAEVTEKGVCWSTTQNPTIENERTNDGAGIGEFVSEITNLEPNTTYYVKAYATNEVGTSYGEEKTFTTLESDKINGYAFVDLGLPSGLKWATCNVGASEPYEVGEYFGWGEVKSKEEYTTANCITFGVPLDDISGNVDYDVAARLWGSTWRMPTEEEARELKDNCTMEWVMISNTLQGCYVTGPNGNQIYLPAAGFKLNTSVDFPDGEGAYWTSTPDRKDYDPGYSTFLYFYNNNFSNIGWFSRYAGLLVRPVSD